MKAPDVMEKVAGCPLGLRCDASPEAIEGVRRDPSVDGHDWGGIEGGQRVGDPPYQVALRL